MDALATAHAAACGAALSVATPAPLVCVPRGCLCCLVPTLTIAPVSSSSPRHTLLCRLHFLFRSRAACVAESNSGGTTCGSTARFAVLSVSRAAYPGGW